MADTSTATLIGNLQTSATGWAAVINGVLDVRTVTDTRNGAALNALFAQGVRVIPTCADTDCDCMVDLLAKEKPGTRLVAVMVQVAHG